MANKNCIQTIKIYTNQCFQIQIKSAKILIPTKIYYTNIIRVSLKYIQECMAK